jgi:DUF1680 family protein
MNASRLIASVAGYFVSASDDAIAFHLYGGISTEVALKAGKVKLTESSTYPWSGDIRIEVTPENPIEFSLRLRIPGWTRDAKAWVNDEAVEVRANTASGYLTIARRWQNGDSIRLELPMPAERIYAHPAVRADVDRVALKRGPLVYCVEESDNPGGAVQRLKLPRRAEVRAEQRNDLFDGVVTLAAEGRRVSTAGWEGRLYRPDPPGEKAAVVTAVPFYLRDNRDAGSMMVWIAEA